MADREPTTHSWVPAAMQEQYRMRQVGWARPNGETFELAEDPEDQTEWQPVYILETLAYTGYAKADG